MRLFRVLLSAFVRGRAYLHFEDETEAKAALVAAGFASAAVYRAASLAPETRGPGSGLAHILEASTR
jgi:hypothetical protein